MKPRFIRFIVPSNTNPHLNVSSPGGIRFISMRPSILLKNPTQPSQIINNINPTTPTAVSPPPLSSTSAAVPPPLLSSTPEAIDLSDETVSEKISSPLTSVSAVETLPTVSLSSTNVSIDKLNTTDAVPTSISSKNVVFVALL